MFLDRLSSVQRLRRRPQRTYRRQRSPRYWIWRGRFQRVGLWFGRNIFKARDWAKSRRESTSIFAEILKTIAGQLLLAVTLVIGLEVLERTVLLRLDSLGPPLADLSGADAVVALGNAFEQLQVDQAA